MASWYPEQRKMTVPRDTLGEAGRREAAKLLEWSASLNGDRKLTYAAFLEERKER